MKARAGWIAGNPGTASGRRQSISAARTRNATPIMADVADGS
ncbi:MAG TPA: hypothetical protein VMC03_02630 [Streptosporangiaceae bacterium]|nr:hypothetical protein [Streptosporangiaceae bacterium]